ncbi:glutathione S-transferase family protein [Pseudohalocynthiibacter aestuariivivens]|nr:glutathione S-transferase family protein [Pseudohalocynthiibacter aestuariivivens]QIE44113.1 glutathione S-transferase family protein [Pseudohalocynthiibacter aestuariivivens]
MPDALRLTGYGPSVYTWGVRLALAELGADYTYVEVDPFAEDGRADLTPLNPFGRVPVLAHGDFTIWETAAILDYIDAEIAGGRMTPVAPQARARMRQVIGIVDAYGYWPMVRQVFANRVFRELDGAPVDEAEIAAGTEHAAPVLTALEAIAAEGLVLDAVRVTLADCHLVPMLTYFAKAPEGALALKRCPALGTWLAAMHARPTISNTMPDLGAEMTGET